MLQANTPKDSPHFTRGGESHFCVGGYLPDGSDGFSEVSRLIVESLMELPTFIPQITLRWTRKTPHEVFRFMLDAERHDPYKRIAFTNDEKRLESYTKICGISFEEAVGYTTVGCNEPAFLGSVSGSTSKGNILRCMDTLFFEKSASVRSVKTFDEFYAVFETELLAELDAIYAYDDTYNRLRAQDINYVSSLFFNGCIESAKSLTQGGCRTAIASPMLLGLTNLIDSLIVIKQFVFEKKFLSMEELIRALQADWVGYEEKRAVILRRGCFFGNDDALSNGVAQRLYHSFYHHLKNALNRFGYHFLIGDLLGYNPHHRWFGEKTRATPDGRHSGDPLKFGIGQSEGRDREGLSALLNALARLDETGIACGNTVTNLLLDPQLVKNDANFEKTVALLETYFQNGGVHFQLTYVSKEDLLAAQKSPENYRSLRVRVSGFSDYFVRLSPDLQNEIVERTVQHG